MTKEISQTLTRTAADDRAEAARDCRKQGTFPGGMEGCTVCGPALAAIQRREAEALLTFFSESWPRFPAEFTGPAKVADAAVTYAYDEAVRARLTLAQRATLLDAARALVKLAIEVAG